MAVSLQTWKEKEQPAEGAQRMDAYVDGVEITDNGCRLRLRARDNALALWLPADTNHADMLRMLGNPTSLLDKWVRLRTRPNDRDGWTLHSVSVATSQRNLI